MNLVLRGVILVEDELHIKGLPVALQAILQEAGEMGPKLVV